MLDCRLDGRLTNMATGRKVDSRLFRPLGVHHLNIFSFPVTTSSWFLLSLSLWLRKQSNGAKTYLPQHTLSGLRDFGLIRLGSERWATGGGGCSWLPMHSKPNCWCGCLVSEGTAATSAVRQGREDAPDLLQFSLPPIFELGHFAPALVVVVKSLRTTIKIGLRRHQQPRCSHGAVVDPSWGTAILLIFMSVLWVEPTSLLSWRLFFLSFLIMKNHVFAKHRLQIERDVLVSVTTVLPHKKNFDRLSSVCFAKPLGCIWWWWSHYALRFWLFENIFGFEKCGSLDFHRPCNKSAFKLYRSIFPDELSLPLLTKMQ